MEKINAFVLSGDVSSQKLVLQVNIPFVDLNKYATFTFMQDPTDDPYRETIESRNEFYQRRTDDDRVRKIKEFIKSSILRQQSGELVATLFPTAILLSTHIDDTSFELHKTYPIQSEIFFSNDLYIVDGQHRLMAMRGLYDDYSKMLFRSEEEEAILNYLKTYMFNCTLLLNFDMWEQALVFADVNFNQKKVDKSLYYTIYGMNYSSNPSDYNRNYIYIAHNLVKFMNTYELSPLKGKIMMLGTRQSNNRGFISQACLAEALMKNIYSPRGIWYVNPSDMQTSPNYKSMAVELLSFYVAVRSCFDKVWPVDAYQRDTILMKTTGVGAMLNLMAYIHTSKLPDEIKSLLRDSDKPNICNEYVGFVKPILQKVSLYQYELFTPTGNYAGTGGRGLVSQLYQRMRELIENDAEEMVYTLIGTDTIKINDIDVDVKYYKDEEGFYSFKLSHYFKNSYQMAPYRPGSGSIAKSMDHLKYKLKLYIDQVEKDATYEVNKSF